VYGCSNDEHEFKIFKDKMPRKKFGSTNNETGEEQGKLHNAKLHNLYPLPTSMRETRSTCRILISKPHRTKLLGRQRWDDNIKT
jgi:hypothetical protein